MKLEISKEECMRHAEQEDGGEISAGTVGRDPAYRSSKWASYRALWAWRIRCLSYWMDEHRIPGGRIVFHIGVRWL